MFCSNCGKQISDNSNFCPSCGNSVTRENSVIDSENHADGLKLESNDNVQKSFPNAWEPIQQEQINNQFNNGKKKKIKPIYIILIVLGSLLTLVILIALIGGLSDNSNKDDYHQNYNQSSNEAFADSINSKDLAGSWKLTMSINDLFVFSMQQTDNKSLPDMGIDVYDFNTDYTIDFYYLFKESGTYNMYYYPDKLVDTTIEFYSSYIDSLKNDKNKFLKTFDVTESELEDNIKSSECESYDAYIEKLKESLKNRGDLMKKYSPEGLNILSEDWHYKIENDKLYVYLDKENKQCVVYRMKNIELVPVAAESNDEKLSNEDLLSAFNRNLVKTSIDLSKAKKSLDADLKGTWKTKTGNDEHSIILLSPTQAVIVDGDDRIEAKINTISSTSFSLESEDFSGLTFSYSNGIITRYENGIPDGYTYEKE